MYDFLFYHKQRNMMTDVLSLPLELICEIYEFEPTKRYQLDKVVHQLRMREVWREAHRVPKYRRLFFFLPWDSVWMDQTEEMYEEQVRFQRRWHRIHGRKPRLNFDDFDLVSEKVTKHNSFFYEEDYLYYLQ